ncbi:uncharacterized protein LOC105665505 isoform X1 [Ceratitis capitata]|uniref:(Mediterranean fruit fly) hypothetical protein n=1 Tax=Ceratitis capitata TaxID=7213 RepID=A0A811U4U6_CERCA|nr:uncharacterized protein LOC105665505 isoform X1 [Ceratitis capitata]CAD6992443.1 unnamed protein product [Ceratitis capitata]
MDERLQQIFHLRPLQEETIAYRNNVKLYRTLMKQTCKAELQNLVNVDMNIVETELKIPDPKLIPPVIVNNNDLTPKIDSLIEEVKMTSIGMKLL